IGIAGPPIKTEQGWFLIYHGTSREKGYCLGAALLDSYNPSNVLARQSEPILEPELDWEINGYIPKVVFSCGQAEIGDKILVYYGGADTTIGVAELDKKNMKFV
ncbi:MAG: glycosidase, partial [Candidatus Caldatribacteriota bacterium]|nr:glycosidase [Candidatus Caldatribacteriota bacterium]